MLYPRIIPCLLVHNKGLIKTVKFKDPKYVGDPINAVKIFNEKEVDEIIVLDIDATVRNNEPDYKMIENLAIECRMPLCYGGGIKTADQAKRILGFGVEKIAISSAATDDPNLVYDIASKVGNQSVVVVLDVKRNTITNEYNIYTHNGTKSSGVNPVQYAIQMEKMGAGEILVNSIDNDGVMKGYDTRIIDLIRSEIDIPITVLGGAGTLEDLGEIVSKYGIVGVSAGSLFVFKGKFRAVLINYPTPAEKDVFMNRYFL